MTVDAKKIKDRANLDVLMHVPLSVTAELGTCKMSVEEVLKLGTGSVIELDRLAGGPVDLLVNNKLIARGEVVAVDENFGVRVTELISKPI
jgi:flagellar motor switch protein FliN/FliY